MSGAGGYRRRLEATVALPEVVDHILEPAVRFWLGRLPDSANVCGSQFRRFMVRFHGRPGWEHVTPTELIARQDAVQTKEERYALLDQLLEAYERNKTR